MLTTTEVPIRVLVVDDHRCVLWGLGKLIDSVRPRMRAVGLVANGVEALSAVAEHTPDVVLLDLHLGDASGLDILGDILSTTDTKVLILTGARDPDLGERAVVAGAKGIVHKDQPAEVILNAIERVHRGEIWLDRSTTAKLLANLSGRRGSAAPDVAANLTPAERKVVAAIVEQRGAPIKVIADALCLSAHTVRNHLASIYTKLGVRGRLELFMFAKERGLDRSPPN